MADASSPPAPLRDLAPSTRSLLMSVVRAVLGMALLLLAYAMLPLDPDSVAVVPFVIVGVGLAAFVALFVRALTSVNAGTTISSKTAKRLGLSNVREVALYAQATLVLPLTKATQTRYSDATRMLDEINLNRSEVY